MDRSIFLAPCLRYYGEIYSLLFEFMLAGEVVFDTAEVCEKIASG
jgi:hypothetical protein